MKTEFRKSFVKDLKKLKNKDLSKKMRSTIEDVESADSLSKISNIKKLKADGNFYRIRVGDYRIGLVVNEGVVIFVRCLHRKDIYKFFPN